MFKRILIAVDDREATGQAIQIAVQLARKLQSSVALVHVVDPSLGTAPEAGIPPTDLLRDFEASGNRFLQAVQDHLRDLDVEQFLRQGDPADQILDVADEWSADLIVVGVQHHSGLAQRLLGSATETVVRESRCPVLTVPAEDD